MDPNAALATLRDESEDAEVRIEAGEALDRWVANGGFMPHTTGYKVGGNTAAKQMLREEIRRTAARLKMEPIREEGQTPRSRHALPGVWER